MNRPLGRIRRLALRRLEMRGPHVVQLREVRLYEALGVRLGVEGEVDPVVAGCTRVQSERRGAEGRSAFQRAEAYSGKQLCGCG